MESQKNSNKSGLQTVAAIVESSSATPAQLSACLDSILSGQKLPENIFLVHNPSVSAREEVAEISNPANNDAISFEAVINRVQALITSQKLPTNLTIFETEAKSFAAAVNEVTDSSAFTETNSRWIWFLHADSVASASALAGLFSVGASSEGVAVVGSKQINPENGYLLNVGFTQTSSSHRVTKVGYLEIDQNQYDQREDTFAVSLNGALVLAETFGSLGGFSSSLSFWGDSLEFCRRVHLAQKRIVVATPASVEHYRNTFSSTSFKKKLYFSRRSLSIFRLSSVNLFLFIPLWFVLFFSAFAASLKQLYSDDLGFLSLLRGQLAGLFSFSKIASLRSLNSKATKIGKAALKDGNKKFTDNFSRLALRKFYATRAEERIINHDKQLEKAATLWAPHSPELLQATDMSFIKHKRRAAFLLTGILLIILSALRIKDAVGALLDGGHFSGAFSSTANLVDVFNAATTNWVNQDFGYWASPNGFLIPLTFLTAISGGSVQTAITLFLVFATLFAGLIMFASIGSFTRNNSLRSLFSLIWVSTPFFTSDLFSGNVQNIFSYCLLPLIPFAFVRATGLAKTDLNLGAPAFRCYFALLGLVSALICASSICMIPPIVALLVIFGLKNQRFWFSLIPVVVFNLLTVLFILRYTLNLSFMMFFARTEVYYMVGILVLIVFCARLSSSREVFSKVQIKSYLINFVIIIAIFVYQVFLPVWSSFHFFQGATSYSVPSVAEKIASTSSSPHILALTTDSSGTIQYAILSGRSTDIINTSPSVDLLKQNADLGEKDQKVREIVAKLLGAPDIERVNELSDLGIGAIFAYRSGDLSGEQERMLSQIDSIAGLTRVVEGNEKAFWRINSQVNQFDDSGWVSALYSPLRFVFVTVLILTIVVYLLLSLPFGTRRIVRYEV